MLKILSTEDDDYDNNNDYDTDAGAKTIVLLPAAEFIYRLGYCESSLGTITDGLACVIMFYAIETCQKIQNHRCLHSF